jgi:hypothetical protein
MSATYGGGIWAEFEKQRLWLKPFDDEWGCGTGKGNLATHYGDTPKKAFEQMCSGLTYADTGRIWEAIETHRLNIQPSGPADPLDYIVWGDIDGIRIADGMTAEKAFEAWLGLYAC